MKRILIAGTSGSCGKTTVSLALQQAFAVSGLTVQSFSAGPDFTQEYLYSFITKRPSQILDTCLYTSPMVRYLLCKNSTGADLSIIDGRSGLYDGILHDALTGSDAELAIRTESPVLLVADCGEVGLSVAAIIRGCLGFLQENVIQGV